MRIGILTFHSQLNYGGVLQSYALQEALKSMGHEVVVIDRWLSPDNCHLKGSKSIKRKVIDFIKGCFLTGVFSVMKRRKRTIRFISEKIHLTKYSFHQWNDLRICDLNVDLIVVGSDQVWNGVFQDPRPYLLFDAPPCPAITYAASFGMKELPKNLEEVYRRGFSNFRFISCRESEGVKLVEREGYSARHVVDPTLLLKPDHWKKIARRDVYKKPTLVCYFLGENIYDVLPKIRHFAKENKCNIRIFLGGSPLPIPLRYSDLLKWFETIRLLFVSDVDIYLSAGPQEFLDAHASATWILTDSFHSVMFSMIFSKNVRIIRPSSNIRKDMFARIEEIASNLTIGRLVVDSIEDALSSFANGEVVGFCKEGIESRRMESSLWLNDAINNSSC